MARDTITMDEKGRLVLPKRIRDEIGAGPDSTFFVRLEGKEIRLVLAENPFDALAEQAVREYRAGRTRTLNKRVPRSAEE